MNLFMAGIDYTMAPVDVRARFSYTETAARDACLGGGNSRGRVNVCCCLFVTGPSLCSGQRRAGCT